MTETQIIWAVWGAGIPVLGVLSALVMGRREESPADPFLLGMFILFWPVMVPAVLACAIALGVIWAAGKAWLWIYEAAKPQQ